MLEIEERCRYEEACFKCMAVMRCMTAQCTPNEVLVICELEPGHPNLPYECGLSHPNFPFEVRAGHPNLLYVLPYYYYYYYHCQRNLSFYCLTLWCSVMHSI